MTTHTNPIRVGALAAALGIALAACSTVTTPAPDEPANNSAATPRNEKEETAIRIMIGDREIRGTVWHNPTGRALIDRLPVTVRMSDHRGQEKGGALPAPLTMDGMPAGDDPRPGELGYFAPTADLVLYYRDAPYWTGIARIGRIDGDVSAIADAPGGAPVTVERAG